MDAIIIIIGIGCFIAGVLYGEMRQNLKFAQKIMTDPEGMIETINKVQSELKRLQAEEKTEIQGLPKDSVEVRIEQVGEQYYVYRVDNEQFLGQGPSRDQVLVEASKRLGNKNLWARDNQQVSQTA